MKNIENVIIIGGGPAGLAAAIYNARAGLKPLVIAGSPPGGQLTLTSEVENYPGFESIMGPDLVDKMRKHALKFGVRIVDENVIKVDFSKRPLEVYLPGKPFIGDVNEARIGRRQTSNETGLVTEKLLTNSIIIATGAKALWLNLPSEQRLRGKGVSACATCDGFFFKEKTVAVIGGGDTAMEEALTLTKFAKKVYIIHRRDSFRASKIMQDRVLKHPKIEVIWNSEVKEILGKEKVEGLRLGSPYRQDVKRQTSNDTNFVTEKQLTLDGVFLAIGHKPDTEVFKDQIELDKKGYIVTSGESSFYKSATSVKGVFAAGDCVDHIYKQAATAVGMGVAAALEVERFLES